MVVMRTRACTTLSKKEINVRQVRVGGCFYRASYLSFPLACLTPGSPPGLPHKQLQPLLQPPTNTSQY